MALCRAVTGSQTVCADAKPTAYAVDVVTYHSAPVADENGGRCEFEGNQPLDRSCAAVNAEYGNGEVRPQLRGEFCHALHSRAASVGSDDAGCDVRGFMLVALFRCFDFLWRDSVRILRLEVNNEVADRLLQLSENDGGFISGFRLCESIGGVVAHDRIFRRCVRDVAQTDLFCSHAVWVFEVSLVVFEGCSGCVKRTLSDYRADVLRIAHHDQQGEVYAERLSAVVGGDEFVLVAGVAVGV